MGCDLIVGLQILILDAGGLQIRLNVAGYHVRTMCGYSLPTTLDCKSLYLAQPDYKSGRTWG